ncbi:MAG TPA: hypothetical protein VIK77_00290 [Tissierellaceae bacterium]|jgi:hypothetical protein
MNKEAIIERLIKEGHITFKEGLILNEKETIYVHQPNTCTYPQIYYPTYI